MSMEERLVTDLSTLSTKELTGLDHETGERAQNLRWRLHFELPTSPDQGFDLELNREWTLGIASGPDVTDLKPFGAVDLGVSRRHLKLLPTETELISIDLGSTNGTRLNDRQLVRNMPYRLIDGDSICLGKLEFVMRVISRPGESDADLRAQADLSEALAQMAKSITSQLDLDLILDRALEMAMSLTLAGEVSVWLLDEKTQELFLVAERGIQDEQVRRMRLPVKSPVLNEVIQTRRPYRARRSDSGEPIKVKTGYIVGALLYVPLIHQDTVFGVLAAAHRSGDKTFSARDERLLEAMADFVALAMHNARLYQKMQEADRLKGEMIQNVSHEFRTPLTYIVGYVELLLDDPGTKLPSEALDSLGIVSKQAQRLTWLVENFVSLESVQHLVAKRTSVDIKQLLNEAVSSARLLAAGREINLALDVQDNMPDSLINKMAILQVLDNLISNAVKFTPEDGKIIIQAKYSQEDKKIRLLVADTGIGIPEEEHERVFERFYQVDGSSRRRFGGVGIGLSVCKAIIDAHGEKIWIESPPEGGTTFAFTLPVAPAMPVFKDTPEEIPPPKN